MRELINYFSDIRDFLHILKGVRGWTASFPSSEKFLIVNSKAGSALDFSNCVIYWVLHRAGIAYIHISSFDVMTRKLFGLTNTVNREIFVPFSFRSFFALFQIRGLWLIFRLLSIFTAVLFSRYIPYRQSRETIAKIFLFKVYFSLSCHTKFIIKESFVNV